MDFISEYKSSANASSFQWTPCVIALCVLKKKGISSPFLLTEALCRGSSHKARLSCQPCFCSGSHGCQPFLALMDVWWVWIMGCQENYLS